MIDLDVDDELDAVDFFVRAAEAGLDLAAVAQALLRDDDDGRANHGKRARGVQRTWPWMALDGPEGSFGRAEGVVHSWMD